MSDKKKNTFNEGIYEMLWDCESCGTQHLLAKTHRHCPICGAPQNAEKRYFPPTDELMVPVQDHVYEGPDLVCPKCGMINRANSVSCSDCGMELAQAETVKPRSPQTLINGNWLESPSSTSIQFQVTNSKGPIAPSHSKSNMKYFLSYSRSDINIAYEVYFLLREHQLSQIWFDQQDILPGTRWETAIKQGLDSSDAMILIASRESMQSLYVKREWSYFSALGKPIYVFLIANAIIDPELAAKCNGIIDFRSDPLDSTAWLEIINNLNYSILYQYNNTNDWQNEKEIRPEYVKRFIRRYSAYCLFWLVLYMLIFISSAPRNSVSLAVIIAVLLDLLLLWSVSALGIRERKLSSQNFAISIRWMPVVFRFVVLVFMLETPQIFLATGLILIGQALCVTLLQKWFFAGAFYTYLNPSKGIENPEYSWFNEMLYRFWGGASIHNSKVRGWLPLTQLDYAEEQKAEFPADDRFFHCLQVEISTNESHEDTESNSIVHDKPDFTNALNIELKDKVVVHQDAIVSESMPSAVKQESSTIEELFNFDYGPQETLTILYHEYDEPYAAFVEQELNSNETFTGSTKKQNLSDLLNELPQSPSSIYINIISKYSIALFESILNTNQLLKSTRMINILLEFPKVNLSDRLTSMQWIDAQYDHDRALIELKDIIRNVPRRYVDGSQPRIQNNAGALGPYVNGAVIGIGYWWLSIFLMWIIVFLLPYVQPKSMVTDAIYNAVILNQQRDTISLANLIITIYFLFAGLKLYFDVLRRNASFKLVATVQATITLMFTIVLLPSAIGQVYVPWKQVIEIPTIVKIGTLFLTLLNCYYVLEIAYIAWVPSARKRLSPRNQKIGLITFPFSNAVALHLGIPRLPQKPFDSMQFLVYVVTALIVVFAVVQVLYV